MVAPAVSIVTPVYNGERFLGESIESVLAQTYSDWEYVILDNASTDGTADIVSYYAQKDRRIRYVKNERLLPILENWNAALGLIHAQSKYCKVIHADDILLPECLERMVAVAELHPSVVIVGGYRIDGDTVNMTSIPYPVDYVAGRELGRRRLLGQWRDLFGSPSSIMYRADVIRRKPEFYNLDNLHADTEVCFELLSSGDYGFVHQVVTVTRRHSDSETVEARRRGTHSAARLLIVERYGKAFLTQEECQFARELQLSFHYKFLGANIFGFRDPDFRRYQLGLLDNCGLSLDVTRLVREATRGGFFDLFRRKKRNFSRGWNE